MRIAVLASGRGSNFQSLIDASERGELPNANLVLLVVNKKNAKAIERAEKHNIDWIFIDHRGNDRVVFDKEMMDKLTEYKVEGIILAAADLRISAPTGVEPVKAILAMRELLASAWPASGP